MKRIAVMVAALWAMQALAEDASAFKDRKAQESYAIGAQTGRTLRKDNVDIDSKMLIRGLQDGLGDKKLLLSEKDLRAVMTVVQQEIRKNMVMNRRALGERNREEGAAYLAANGAKAGVETTTSGLQYKEIKAGTGAKPGLSSTVLVNYRGTLLNGFEFDTSPDDKPAEIVVAQLTPGMREALLAMAVGSKWQLAVPANLGYGERGMGADVGPYQVLLFDLELVGIK